MKVEDLILPLKKMAKIPKAKLGGVACFFIKNGAIISSGINYNPTGKSMEEEIDGKWITRPEVVHAEIAAIESAKENGVNLADSTLILTMSPCIKCAKVIAKTGIKELYYIHEWWDKAALDLLREQGIKVSELRKETK